MNPDKQIIIDEIKERIDASPFVIITQYDGLTVPQFDELRTLLAATGSEYHVAKNTFVKRAAADAGVEGDLSDMLTGQTAFATGESDISAAAKVIKDFHKKTKKPIVVGGILDNEILDAAKVGAMADLPSKEVLQATLLGVLNQPAQRLVTVLNEPGASLARVLAAKAEKGE